MLLTNAVEIGRRLTEAKELIPHGEWLKWLTESMSYSRSTASRLMKIFREYGSILSSPDEEESPNGASMHHLNYTQELILFGIPVEDRDQFIADNDVGNMSKRELRQTLQQCGSYFPRGLRPKYHRPWRSKVGRAFRHIATRNADSGSVDERVEPRPHITV
nr:DUF3102 domain-containing protein [Desulfosporosinus fructosivorans]